MLNRYGVIVCPSCKNAKVVELSKKTTTCYRCKKIINLKKIKLHFKSDSQKKARYVVGILNAEKDGNKNQFVELIRKQKS